MLPEINPPIIQDMRFAALVLAFLAVAICLAVSIYNFDDRLNKIEQQSNDYAEVTSFIAYKVSNCLADDE